MPENEKSSMPKWSSYRGVEIKISDSKSPLFLACVNGKHLFADSYDTLTKKIDAAVTFEPFDALRIVGKHIDKSGIQQIRITGVERGSRGLYYLYQDGECSRDLDLWTTLYPLSARQQIQIYLALKDEAADVGEKYKEKIRKAEEKLPKLLRADGES